MKQRWHSCKKTRQSTSSQPLHPSKIVLQRLPRTQAATPLSSQLQHSSCRADALHSFMISCEPPPAYDLPSRAPRVLLCFLAAGAAGGGASAACSASCSFWYLASRADTLKPSAVLSSATGERLKAGNHLAFSTPRICGACKFICNYIFDWAMRLAAWRSARLRSVAHGCASHPRPRCW